MMTAAQSQQIDAQMSWEAVQSRDHRFDGQFVYSVRSTGVYCRPSCPSRRPGPGQVLFFSGPEDAREAGFRACRRCLPDLPPGESPHTELVRRACEYLEQALGERALGRAADDGRDGLPTIVEVGHAVGASPSRLQRAFKKETGVTLRQYGQAKRLERFKSLVREGNGVTLAMYDAGYTSPSRLYEDSAAQLGMSPGQYGKGGPGATIYHTVVTSPLGWLLVAATGLGVCAVKLGDEPAPLAEELFMEFPAAKHLREEDRLQLWVGEILVYLEGRQPGLDLPLDVRATVFQRRVWQLLQAIPYGETRTYQEIARDLGLENGSRAVGRACATNPVSLVVPCHRARRKDGGLAGYRWGLHRKKALLAMEEQGLICGA